jgi:hypothetical protein
MTLIEQYEQLLIKQYYNQANARSEVAMKAGQIVAVKEFMDALAASFDLDFATDDRLDKIGKLVGIARNVPLSTPKILFGFVGDITARPMADLFNTAVESAPLYDLFEPEWTDTQLDNEFYRNFIRIKIAKNNVRGFMAGDNSIQNVVNYLFNGNGVIFDNFDMTLSLQIPYEITNEYLILISRLDLLPRPNGVNIRLFMRADSTSLAFADDDTGLGFADLFDATVPGGAFAELIL